MEYKESNVSKCLFRLNKRFLDDKKNPKWDNSQQFFENFIHLLFGGRIWMHRNILHRSLYDKYNVNLTKEYSLEPCIEYDYMPKIVIYTCIIGRYDSLMEPLYYNDSIKYVAVTDFEIPSESVWERVDIDTIDFPEGVDNIRKARYIKLHPHKLFGNFDVSIWIDGNVLIFSDFVPMVLSLNRDKFFAIHLHGSRKNISTESRAITYSKRPVEVEKLKKQINSYYNSGYRDNIPLLETTILIRKHNDCRCIELMDLWWEEIVKYTTRDQISLPYVINSLNYTIDDIDILGEDLRLNPRFRCVSHR